MTSKTEVAKQDRLEAVFRASDKMFEPLAGGIAYVSTAVALGAGFLSFYFPSPSLTELLRGSVETAVVSGVSKVGLSTFSGKLSDKLHAWEESAGDRLIIFTERIAQSARVPSMTANFASGVIGVISAVGAMVDSKFVPLAWDSLKLFLTSAGVNFGTWAIKKVANRED